MQELPLEIRLPVSHRGLADLAVNFLKKLWLADVEVSAGKLGGSEVSIPVYGRRELLEIGIRGLMVGGLRIPQRDIIERCFSQLLFHLEDGLRGGLRLGVVIARKLEHGGNVYQIFFAGVLETLFSFEVVVAVRKAKAAGRNTSDRLRGIVIVRHGGEHERDKNEKVIQLANHALQISRSLHGINLFQHGLGRRDAQFVHGGFIHA